MTNNIVIDQNTIPAVFPVQQHEINTPNLGMEGRTALMLALNSHLAGIGDVHVSVLYNKQTEAKPRIAGRDYLSLPGISMQAHLGKITDVFRRKGDQAVRFRIKTLTRPDGNQPFGWITIIPEGLTSFIVTGFNPNLSARPFQNKAPAPPNSCPAS